MVANLALPVEKPTDNEPRIIVKGWIKHNSIICRIFVLLKSAISLDLDKVSCSLTVDFNDC
jgi:hypothetical protein